MYCSNCGAELSVGANYCSGCGKFVAKNTAEQKEQPKESYPGPTIPTETITKLLKLTNGIEENFRSLDLTADKKREIKSQLEIIDWQVNSPEPSVEIVYESLNSILSILKVAPGDLGANLCNEVRNFLLTFVALF